VITVTLQAFPFRTTHADALARAARPVGRAALAGLVLASCTAYADGDLDPSFGIGGRVTASFDVTAPFTDKASKILKIPSGGYFIVGSASGGSGVLVAILRLDESGQPVASFGAGGELTIDACMTEVNDAALDANGRILVAGTTSAACGTTGAPDGRLIRLTSAGALDTSFSVDGIANVRYTTTSDGMERALVVVVRSSGEILVGGSVDGDGAGTALVDNAAFQRFTSAGVDLNVISGAFTGTPQRLTAGLELADGSVVWAMARNAPLQGQGSGYIWKLTPSLVSDNSFAGSGVRPLQVLGSEEGCGAERVHVPQDIVAFGNTFKVFGFASAPDLATRSWYASVDNAAGAPNYAIRCLTTSAQGSVSVKAANHHPTGSPDTIALAGLCGQFVADQCVMRVVSATPGSNRLVSLDPEFNAGNPLNVFYVTSVQPGGGDGTAVRTEADGRIVVAGSRVWNFSGDTDFALARFRRPDVLLRNGFEAN
jgi:uncharacterized delta-60 repeat protein